MDLVNTIFLAKDEIGEVQAEERNHPGSEKEESAPMEGEKEQDAESLGGETGQEIGSLGPEKGEEVGSPADDSKESKVGSPADIGKEIVVGSPAEGGKEQELGSPGGGHKEHVEGDTMRALLARKEAEVAAHDIQVIFGLSWCIFDRCYFYFSLLLKLRDFFCVSVRALIRCNS